jgi:mono/diheme cytochrome c family protein
MGIKMNIVFKALTLSLATAIAFVVPGRPAMAETLVERGAYLVRGIAACGNCHSPQAADGSVTGPALSGGEALVQPAFTAYPPNLTPDPETGLGNWTEDQIVTSLRDGHTPSGALLRPPMPVPFYRGLSDRDAHAIALYLRSLPPVTHQVPPSEYRRPMPTTYGAPVDNVPDPDPNDRIARGQYLAQLGHCMECHTARDAAGHPDMARYGGGGLVLAGVFGEIPTPNITPDIKAGIGGWTDRQIKDALTHGIKPDGAQLAPPMPWPYLAKMRDEDVDALVAYLRTVKPVSGI